MEPIQIKKTKNTFIYAGIGAFILVVGIGSIIYFGLGHTRSSNLSATPSLSQPATSTLIVKTGDEVDPTVKNDIVAAYLKEKALFTSGNVVQIRQYVIDGTPSSSKAIITQQITALPASDMQKIIANYNELFSLVSGSALRSATTTWAFTSDMEHVQITVPVASSTSAIPKVTINMIYNNGEWY
jgi:hypothetical protein